MRLLLVRLHRWLGLATAIFLAFAGLTGSLIAFQPELDAWLNPQLFRVDAARPSLSIERLAAEVERADPTVMATFIMPAQRPGSSTLVTVEPRIDPATGSPYPARYNQVFVDPATGTVLGARLYGAWRFDTQHLLPFIVVLHYSLHIPDRWGDLLLGIVAVVWLFDSVIGFWLTLPVRSLSTSRSWWQRWKPSWQIKRAAGAVRLNFDLHRAGGLWLWGLLIAMALTSIAMNLGREVFVPAVELFGVVTPSPLAALTEPEHKPEAAPVEQPPIGWDAAVVEARRNAPAHASDWSVHSIYFAAEQRVYEVTLIEPGDHDTALRLGRERFFIDGNTGERVAHRSYDDSTAADKFLAWQYPLHSGQIGGLAGRIVVCLLGLAVCMLSITGIVIWARKRRARQHQAHRSAQVLA
ncbi:PepSY-associated TM helix domain-containing protein [Roseateles sp. BYS180W]|uniref:PepSY-associated TM helix domain-containing protein n=1 Tax=Roseateles rivi TaxID=3299028 RepID=A0ABW7FZL4_9BURK